MAITVSVSPDPILRFVDNAGNALNGGQLLTQVGGVNYVTYSDPAGSVPLPNPIILNSRGEISTSTGVSTPLFLDQSVAYIFTLSDSQGNFLWNTPPITPPATVAGVLAALTAAILAPILNPEVTEESTLNAVVTNYYPDVGNPYRYGAVGDGVSDDTVAIQTADKVSAGINKALIIPNGKFAMNSNYSYTAPVVMQGGVLTGSGVAIFGAGFTALAYYCLDCAIGQNGLNTPFVLPEWFGANRQQLTVAGADSPDISTKAWNAWPSFIVGANFGTNQNWGNAAYLLGNKPFLNTDSWDFVALQRCIWLNGAIGNGAFSQRTQLMGGIYYLSQAIRWNGNLNNVTFCGAGRLITTIEYLNAATAPTITTQNGAYRCLMDFYFVGGAPTLIQDLGIQGPQSYTFGSLNLAGVLMQGANGVVFDNCWNSIGEVGWYCDQGCSDNEVRGCTTEYLGRVVYVFESTSWMKINNATMFFSGGPIPSTGVEANGYVFMNNTLMTGQDTPIKLTGRGSRVNALELILRNQTNIGGPNERASVETWRMSRTMQLAANGVSNIASLQMYPQTALRVRVTVGGQSENHGACGASCVLLLAYGAAGSVATVAVSSTGALEQWGAGDTVVPVTAPASAAGGLVTIQVNNTNTAGTDVFVGTINVEVEGDEFIWGGLGP